MLKCAIDLLWVRPKQVGGIESVARNLLDGFMKLKYDFEFWLLVSKDNVDSFRHYSDDNRFHIEVCDVLSSNVGSRIIWQNLHLGRKIKSLGLNKCFEPYYCKPVLGTKGIKFLTIIHDLQAMHYPEYFSKGKVIWMKFSWWNAVRTSKIIIAISDYVTSSLNELIDAGKIDGCTNRQCRKYIVMPLMISSFIICIFLTITRCFMTYDLNFALTEGNPFGSTVMASMFVYRKAFSEKNYGLGQTEAMLLFAVCAAVALFQVFVTKRKEIEA